MKTSNRLSDNSDPFGPLAAEAEAIRLVEIEIPPGWRVRVIEGSEFQVRLAAIEAESDDDGDSNGVSPSQSKGP